MARRRIATAAAPALAALALLAPATAGAGFDTLSTVSVNAAGDGTGAGAASSPSGSSDGRYVVFASQAPAADLVRGAVDANLGADVFLRDRAAGTTALVSHAAGPTAVAAGAVSGRPVVSPNGRWVAFVSQAGNLVLPPAIGGSDHVYLYDRTQPDPTVLVDHAASSAAGAGDRAAGQVAAVTDDGHVVYTSNATDLVAGQSDSNDAPDVFVYDPADGSNLLVSHSTAGAATASNATDTGAVSASADASSITFSSSATDVVAGTTIANVYLWKKASPDIALVSHSSSTDTSEANAPSTGLAIGADGGYLLYESAATDAGAGQTAAVGSGPQNVFLYDTAHNTSTLVSRTSGDANAAAGGALPEGALSSDGRYAAWVSTAGGVVGSNPAGPRTVYLYSRETGTNALVSHASGAEDTAANNDSRVPAIAADGGTVAYESDASDLVSGQASSGSQVFAYDRASRQNTLVSHTASPATGGNGASQAPRFSGSLLLFESAAADLGSPAPDSNGTVGDVFAAETPVPPVPPVTRQPPDPGPTTTTPAQTVTAPGGPPPSPTLQVLLTILLNRTAGPCDVRIMRDYALIACGADRRSKPDLRVYVVNARGAPMSATLSAVETLPRIAAAAKKASYSKKRVSVPAFGSATLALKVPAKLRSALLKALKKRRTVARAPTVTLTAAGVPRTFITHAVTMRRK